MNNNSLRRAVSPQPKYLATGLAAVALLFDAGACRASQFSQRMVASGRGGEPTCSQGTDTSPETFVCHPSEAAPTAGERTMVVTASGHAIASVVVTDDGFGTGQPVLAVKAGKCPAGAQLEDGSQEQIGAKAEFVITPAEGGPARTVGATLAQPQAGRLLGKDKWPMVFGSWRLVFALPALGQPMSTSEPVDLGEVHAGDRIKLRLLAAGTLAWCENGAIQHQSLSTNLWTATSTERLGYLATPTMTGGWDDKRVSPFKAVATISY